MASTSSSYSGNGGGGGGGFHLTFTQGFLVGQLSVIVLALWAIRYFIFEESSSSRGAASSSSSSSSTTATKRAKWPERGRLPHDGAAIHDKDGAAAAHEEPIERDIGKVMAEVLACTSYDVASHLGESLDWVNVIVGQALAGYREDVNRGGGGNTLAKALKEEDSSQSQGQSSRQPRRRSARDVMEEVLNRQTIGRGMSFLDPIHVSDVQFGQSYPVFTNARVRPADASGRMRVEVDVDYTDALSLSIDTKVLINLPRPRFAVLPLSLGLVIERFSGTLALELVSASPHTHAQLASEARSRHQLRLSLHPDFELDARATSLVGSRAKLQDVPKIEQLLVARLRAFVHDRFVWPRYWSLTLPDLVPRADRDGSQGASQDQEGQDVGQDELDEEKEEEEQLMHEDVNGLGDETEDARSLYSSSMNGVGLRQRTRQAPSNAPSSVLNTPSGIGRGLGPGMGMGMGGAAGQRLNQRPGPQYPRPTLTHSHLRASQQQLV